MRLLRLGKKCRGIWFLFLVRESFWAKIAIVNVTLEVIVLIEAISKSAPIKRIYWTNALVKTMDARYCQSYLGW